MKAMRIHELGGRLKLGEVPVPKPGPNEVLVKVKATGVGLTVVLMLSTRGLVTQYPRTPGHELAGVLEEVGSEVEGWKKGDRGTTHFYLTCRVCKWCRGSGGSRRRGGDGGRRRRRGDSRRADGPALRRACHRRGPGRREAGGHQGQQGRRGDLPGGGAPWRG